MRQWIQVTTPALSRYPLEDPLLYLPQRGVAAETHTVPSLPHCCAWLGAQLRLVQSPSVSNSPAAHGDNLQRDISELKHKEASLDKEIERLEAEGYCTEELDKHISLLHEYNELKDTGQMLLGRLALLRGVTTKDLYAEFGLDLED